ncbi:MAG TPA: MarR family transcriptional regulator [Clostridium sp.]|jgi:DNA-binding MarR family transcriptional regulator|uniref:MarR family winged helix-turn-helix transcriptional regulator n=1 Tax=Clostridium lapidicellarium TaxID=3240931 RepID=A0ABV4DVH7_9CLOT|nr:MarR family transcriptional regulator [uncultured Clostridium sp.]NLU07255.1 winged helix DNA-binding protein [Clostridiales bacterium]HBC97345.1 MarR family transcriptional regulator [Clostridium sp.]
MNKGINVINELLVDLFNDILEIEQKSLQYSIFKDLSITEIHTIEAIGMYKPRTMTEVASQLDITLSTLTTAINHLVRKEYVVRERSEQDRRIVFIKLTKKGKLAFRVHQKFHSDMVKETISGLTKQEEKTLVKSLEKLNKFFKAKYNLETGLKGENNE